MTQKKSDDLRRERRRLVGVFRRELRAREMRVSHASRLLGIHKNSIYRLMLGEDGRLSSYQRVARALGLRIEVVNAEDVLQLPEGASIQCPKCETTTQLPPGDDSGRTVCPSCQTALRVKKVVSYVARVDRSAGDSGGEV